MKNLTKNSIIGFCMTLIGHTFNIYSPGVLHPFSWKTVIYLILQFVGIYLIFRENFLKNKEKTKAIEIRFLLIFGVKFIGTLGFLYGLIILLKPYIS